jgi:hypothetical protein
MAVTRYTEGYPDPTNYYKATGELSQLKVNCSCFDIPVTTDDVATSVHYLARIPSHALILPISTLLCTAITGLTSYSVGLTNLKGTTVANALVNAQTLASATSVSLVAAVTAANRRKRAWQLLGLSSDPGGVLSVIGTVNADAGTTGIITGELYWGVGF